jgi:DNA-binding protein HU-beta
MSMNKSDLISTVARTTGQQQVDVAKTVEGVLATIRDALTQGDDVRLLGFGTFSVGQRAASQARNPQTGATIQVPASKQARFKAGKALKAALN